MPESAPDAGMRALAQRVTDALERGEGKDFPGRLAARDASLWSTDPAVQESIRQRLGWLDSPSAMASRTSSRWSSPASRSLVTKSASTMMPGIRLVRKPADSPSVNVCSTPNRSPMLASFMMPRGRDS